MNELKRGRWVCVGPDMHKWIGPTWPPEQRGQALIYYSFDEPCEIRNALFEDMTRGTLTHRCIGNLPTWRHRRQDGLYVYGEIALEPCEVRFFECAYVPTRAMPQWEGPNLERDLRLNFRICDMAKQYAFAVKVYQALCNNRWFFRAIPSCGWECTCRTAGAIVASMRDKREEYNDFYLLGGEGLIDEQVRMEFFRLGWAEDELYECGC